MKIAASDVNVPKSRIKYDVLLDAKEVGLGQFRYFKIQLSTIDLGKRLRGIKYSVCGFNSSN